MPTIENDSIVFRFPDVEKKSKFSIDFMRTLRIPDSDKSYPLPPGLGTFPLRHVEDYSSKLPDATNTRGGVILPMWQAEAMWLSFHNHGPDYGLEFPVAIKIAAGKINAVTGDAWTSGLHREPQDYMVSPEQPWLDGFAIEKGIIRQFVAMPLGEGYSVEEQLTGKAEWGGLQIQVIPLKQDVWKKYRDEWEDSRKSILRINNNLDLSENYCSFSINEYSMGMAAGGRMKQEIYEDNFELDDWDFLSAQRVFITLIHAKDWNEITGEVANNYPPTAQQYIAAGLPWFDYYGVDQKALPGSEKLAKVKSVGNLYKTTHGSALPNSEDVDVGITNVIGQKSKYARPIKGNFPD